MRCGENFEFLDFSSRPRFFLFRAIRSRAEAIFLEGNAEVEDTSLTGREYVTVMPDAYAQYY